MSTGQSISQQGNFCCFCFSSSHFGLSRVVSVSSPFHFLGFAYCSLLLTSLESIDYEYRQPPRRNRAAADQTPRGMARVCVMSQMLAKKFHGCVRGGDQCSLFVPFLARALVRLGTESVGCRYRRFGNSIPPAANGTDVQQKTSCRIAVADCMGRDSGNSWATVPQSGWKNRAFHSI